MGREVLAGAAPGREDLAPARARIAALPLLAAIGFISSLGISIMLPLLPLYGLSLGAGPVELGALTAAFAVANSGGQFLVGLLVDRLGSRRFIWAGTALYAVANVLIATAPTALALILYRSLGGLGSGASIVATRLYLTQSADPARLAFVNGVLSAADSAGNVLGPAFGGMVAVAADLRMPFVIVAVTSGLALSVAAFLPRPRPAPSAATDPDAPVWGRSVIGLFASDLLMLVAFGAWITSYAPFATSRLGWTTFEVGIIFTVLGLGDITLGPWLAHLADRTGRRRMAVLCTIPVALFGVTLVAGAPRPVLYLVSFLTGAGVTAFTASWFALLASAVPAHSRGRVFGVVSALANGGTVLGAVAASVLWETRDLGDALILASIAVLAAGLILLAHPRNGVSAG